MFNLKFCLGAQHFWGQDINRGCVAITKWKTTLSLLSLNDAFPPPYFTHLLLTILSFMGQCVCLLQSRQNTTTAFSYHIQAHTLHLLQLIPLMEDKQLQ